MGKTEKKVEVSIAAIALLVAITTLVFGDNIYTQFTGRLIADDMKNFFNRTTPTPMPTQIAISGLYDDFKNSAYENKFNDVLWSIYGGGVNYSATAVQKNEVLVLSDSEPVVGEGIILYLQKWEEDTFTSFEATVKILQTQGRASISLGVQAPELAVDTGIGIDSNPSPATVGVYHRGNKISTRVVEYNTWYKIQIKYNRQNNTFEYYLDDELVDSGSLPDGISKFTPAIQLWHELGSVATAFVKDVKIYK